MKILVVGVALLNLSLYLFWRVLGLSLLSSTLAIIAVFVIFFVLKRYLFEGKDKTVNGDRFVSWLSTGLILFNLILIAWVWSPYVRLIKVDNFQSVGLSSVTDIFKHSYVVTAVKSFGLPPSHPYFPEAKFSYYYGYYLVPALLSQVWPQGQNFILFGYVLLTDLLALALLKTIIFKYIRNNGLRIFSLALILFGMGGDVIPMFLNKSLSHPSLIEMWSISAQLGLRIDNTFVSLLWAPQHFLAAALALWLLTILDKSKLSVILGTILFSFVCLSSAFVALGLFWALIIVFILKPSCRRSIFLVGLGSGLILLPYLLDIASRSSSIFSFYHFSAFPFLKIKFFDYFLTLLVDYGALFLLLPILLVATRMKSKIRTLAIILVIYGPVLLTIFIKSAGYNDLALRITILSQFLVVITYFKIVDECKYTFLKRFLMTMAGICLLFSAAGFVFEYVSRWRTRQILDPYTSELILKLRRVDQNILFAASGKDEWIFKIPPLAFRPIFTSDLYDSGGYLVDNPIKTFGDYESDEKNIFYRQNEGDSLDKIVLERNTYMMGLAEFFRKYSFDWIIFDKRIGVKEGVNPWLSLFDQMEVEKRELTPTFVAFNRKSILEKLTGNVINIDLFEKLFYKIEDNKVVLPGGWWYLAACNQESFEKVFRFEAEDTYKVWEASLANKQCVGNLYFIDKEKMIKLAGNTTKEIFLIPVGLLKQL